MGAVVKNDEPLTRNEVSLIPKGKGKKTLDVETDETGHFVFENVEPGSYSLATSIFVEAEIPEGQVSPIEFGGPCSAESGFEVLVTYGTSKRTGREGYLAYVNNGFEQFNVEAGDRVEKDISFECGE